ncbi:hypothetical protein KC906_01025 [Candidatus Kaiserbacteria bacterium]|nr:hypothetical protein [Candidatus Kaiserbacteria bacterium]
MIQKDIHLTPEQFEKCLEVFARRLWDRFDALYSPDLIEESDPEDLIEGALHKFLEKDQDAFCMEHDYDVTVGSDEWHSHAYYLCRKCGKSASRSFPHGSSIPHKP